MMSERTVAKPPIVQMVATIQFAPVLDGATMLDIVELYKEFAADYPVFQQLPRASEMTADPEEVITASMKPVEGELPRALFVSEDLRTSVVMQVDRFACSWQRESAADSAADYPGHESMLNLLYRNLGRFHAWVAGRNLPTLSPVTAELSYMNVFPLTHGTEKRHLSDIFTFFSNPQKIAMRAFHCGWIEGFELEGRTGLVDVGATVSALMVGEMGAVLNLTGAIDVKGASWEDTRRLMILTHGKIARTFDASVRPSVLGL
jgi:uncharacterized protein (TIGR04255 family)